MENQVSLNAYRRLLFIHDREIAAAKRIASSDGYADFFVEASGGSWQEGFGDPDSPSLVEKLGKDRAARRMAYVERIRRQLRATGDDDSYHDYFADGPGDPSGPDWDEVWTEKADDGRPTTQQLLIDPAARVRALSQLKVVQAYLRMRERLASK